MPKYLVSVSYTAEGARGLRQDGGTQRRDVATHAIESVGGKVESFYFPFGEHDAVIIADLPDAATALLTPEEMDHAAGKKTAYKAPGA